VLQLYRQTVLSVLGGATRLGYARLGWGDEQCTALARVLPLCTCCTDISLRENVCGDAGALALAAALRAHPMPLLEELYLDDNQIGEAGVCALAEAIEAGALPSLRKLRVEKNPGITERLGWGGRDALMMEAWKRACKAHPQAEPPDMDSRETVASLTRMLTE
jgi:hypothetical protein